MSVRTIIKGEENNILRTKCKPVQVFDKNLKDFVVDMIETMTQPLDGSATGIGIAAPQINVDLRIFIVTTGLDNPRNKNQKIVAMINPEILSFSDHTCVLEEGCLSLPNTFGNVRRPSKIKIKWQNVDGKWCEKKFEGWDARVIQHEYDHINGILFIDRMDQ